LLSKLKAGLKHAFAVDPPGHEFSEEEIRIADKLADFVVKRRLTAPAVLFVKSSAPLNMIANQLLVFLNPFATFIFNKDEYRKFTEMLEHRNSMDFLVTRIEEAERRLQTTQGENSKENAEKDVGQRT